MGCDIHLHVETKTPNGWQEVEGLRDFYNGRNHWLFHKLAGVRDGVTEPICDPRGTPDDLSYTVRAELEAWECDAHSRTWFTLAELQAQDWTPIESPLWSEALRQVAAHPHVTADSRVVMYFDN